ncbi:MAG: NDP-sugar synthase [Methanomassiliicoccales archaeon]|nr:NDP-sugar synthase [Methanomassiliicoccales archaeon]
MKALILAGGAGTRLRPLTNAIPKPLVPLLGRPLVMHIIDSLPKEVDTVVLAVSYMKGALESYFRQNDCGRKVVLINEEEPLGTGGAIRNARQYLDEMFLCFNGDVISSLDLTAFLDHHRRHGGIGTLALWRVADPSAFGVAKMLNGRITEFQEKPSPGTAVSDLINAGTYAFEPELLDHIGDGFVSLEREVFPKILERGLHGYQFTGHWVDCGTLESYLNAQSVLIDDGEDVVCVQRQEGARLIGANHLDGVTLSHCRVGPHVCAMRGSSIMDGSTVERSVLMEGAQVGKGCVIKDCILGPGAQVKDGQTLNGEILVRGSSA